MIIRRATALGHGTATASVAAGNVNSAGAVTFNGMAPKAFLGNYKVLGTGYSSGTLVAFEDAVVQAIEDAFTDGMDIVSCSLGVIALTDPRRRISWHPRSIRPRYGGMVMVVVRGQRWRERTDFPHAHLQHNFVALPPRPA